MNIQTLHALAAKRFQEAYQDGIISEKNIVIPDYLNEHDFDVIVGDDDNLNFLESRLYSTIFADLLVNAGAKVEFEPMCPLEFYEWLNATGQMNEPQTRAAYCSLKNSGEFLARE